MEFPWPSLFYLACTGANFALKYVSLNKQNTHFILSTITLSFA